MNIEQFIENINQKNIRIDLNGEELKLSAPKGSATPELLSELKKRKLEIIKFLKASSKNVSSNQSQKIISANRSENIPLSQVQERFWFISQFDQEAAKAYHIDTKLRINGQLDCDALNSALNHLMQRHEILRTTYVNGDDLNNQNYSSDDNENRSQVNARQVIRQDIHFPLVRIDLSSVKKSKRDAALAAQITEEESQAIDLVAGPIIRGRLCKLTPTEHVLMITVHHIAIDGWSLDIIKDELAQLYEYYACSGELEKDQLELEALTLQYADYAVWQRERMESGVEKEQLNFWKNELKSAPTLLHLPSDYPRPAVQSFKGDKVGFQLDSQLEKKIRQYCKQQGVTAYMVLLSAWSALLSRLSGEADFVIGTPVSHRGHRDLERVVGCFVNTLALRIPVIGDSSGVEFVQQVKEKTLNALANKDVAFEQVVEAINPARSLSYNPLFQAMFSLNHSRTRDVEDEEGDIVLSEMEDGDTNAKTDISLEMNDDGEIGGEFIFSSDLFKHSTIQRWVGYYKILLKSLVTQIDLPVGEIPLVKGEEFDLIVRSFNEERTLDLDVELIHQIIDQVVDTHGDRDAVVHNGSRLSYSELESSANQLAHYLIDQGIKESDPVAIFVETGFDMVIASLAVLKSGGAYLPIDIRYPDERVGFILSDAQPKVVISQEKFQALLTSQGVTTALLIDTEKQQLETYSTFKPNYTKVATTGNSLAYLIYTSGSTGIPKGAMLEHKGLCNIILESIDLFNATPESRVLQLASFGFDACIWETMLALCSGASLYLNKRTDMVPGGTLEDTMREQEITHIFSPPAALQCIDIERCPSSLQTLFIGGDVTPVELAKKWAQSGRDFIHVYGPTETTIATAFYPYRLDKPEKLPLGWPMANTQIYILDGHMSPTPIGVTGEMYIGGVGVARGYLNREDLNEEKFVEDIFYSEKTKGGANNAEESARLYKTGDLARWSENGELEFIGRNDYQVKIRGFRIELGEIESHLTEHDSVSEAVVLVEEAVRGQKKLLAYLVFTPGFGADIEILREELGEKLPPYMIPHAFFKIDKMPLTQNAKVDRKALANLDVENLLAEEFVAPIGNAECDLADVWKMLLGFTEISRTANFFDIGGHSLLIAQMVSNMSEKGWGVTVRDVYDAKDLQSLAKKLAASNGKSLNQDNSQSTGIPTDCQKIVNKHLDLIDLSQTEIKQISGKAPGGSGNIQDIYPLAPLQEGILFHHLLAESANTYVIPKLLKFESKVSLDKFIDAMKWVINRHDILRTAVIWQGLDKPVQLVLREVTLQLREFNLSPSEDVQRQLDECMSQDKMEIDIQTAPMQLLEIASHPHTEEWFMVMKEHHLISDHVSLEIIVEEITAFLEGTHTTLPAPVQFKNYVASSLDDTHRKAAQGFFSSELGNFYEPSYPFDISDVYGDGQESRQAECKLASDVAQQLRSVSKKSGTSPAALFHMAWGLVVAYLSGRDDVVFGTVMSGRLQGTIGAERMLGMLINLVPLRLELENLSVDEYFQLTIAKMKGLLAYEQYPLTEAQKCSGVPSSQPLFSSVMNYRHSEDDESNSDGQKDDQYESSAVSGSGGVELLDATEYTNYPLSLAVDDEKNDFSLTVAATDGIEPEKVLGYMRNALAGLLDCLIKNEKEYVLRIPLLSDNEFQEVIGTFNKNQAEFPSNNVIHDMIEAQVDSNPRSEAIRLNGRSLNYGQLDTRANQIANYLIGCGVGEGQLIGIYLDRSIDMVEAIFAVMKTGAAYLPLDPHYPAERVETIINDAQPNKILTMSRQAQKLPVVSNTPFDEKNSVLLLDELYEDIDNSSQVRPVVSQTGANENTLAYVIYTSGSTGKPKGVLLEHKGLCNLASAQKKMFNLDSKSRVLQFSSLGFDACTWEIVMALCSGACLVLAEKDDLLPGLTLENTLRNEHISHATLPPSAVSNLNRNSNEEESFPDLTTLVVAGEACPISLAKEWNTEHRQFVNAYGPSESTVCATACFYDPENDSSFNIGHSIQNTSLYILDRYLKPVPVGVKGELHIGGYGLARGYLNRVEMTEQRFVDSKLQKGVSERLYKTGDLGIWNSDGSIQFCGRNDDQIKIRGFRVELGEIEAHLNEIDPINEVCVVATGSGADKRLTAYFTTENGAHFEIDTIKRQLIKLVPDYMVPNMFVYMDALPLTPNGKVDRKFLTFNVQTPTTKLDYQAPVGRLEEQLVSIWQDLLQLSRVGTTEGFTDLGGNSLMAIKLVNKLAKEGFDVTLSALIAHSTVSSLAKYIRSNRLSKDDSGEHDPILLKSGDSTPPLFLVHTVSGDLIPYYELIEELDLACTIYGLDFTLARDFDDSLSIEGLAASHIKRLKAVAPTGPYRLAGYSMAGDIVLEMANQLREQGEDVDYLGLFDSRVDSKNSDARFMTEIMLLGHHAAYEKIVAEVEAGRTPSNELPSPTMQAKVVRGAPGEKLFLDNTLINGWLTKSEKEKLYQECLAEGLTCEEWIQRVNINSSLIHADIEYAKPMVDVSAHLYSATIDSELWLLQKWGEYCTLVSEVELSGAEHGTILERPFVDVIATHIQDQFIQLNQKIAIKQAA